MSAANIAPLTPVLEVTLKNILVTTDFSACSEAAVKIAASLARQHQSQIILLHTIEFDPVLPNPVAPTTKECELEQELTEQAMQKIRNSPALAGLQVKTLTAGGDVLAVMRRLISEDHIDLVVIGTHGRTGFRKLLMGSVAEEAERLLCCPVLTVGPCVHPETLTHGQFQSILYATDFSTGSQHALTYAVRFARESGAQLHMLHVMLEEMVTEFYLHDEMEHSCKERLSRLIPPGVMATPLDVIVCTGMPAEEIVKQAILTAADLIVMGIHASGWTGAHASAHIPWSVANAVVAHAPCPVLTVCGKAS
jgi:nucleotide-binding universal stress UspA family protein